MFSATRVMAIAALLAGLTSAQSESSLPACAQTCVGEYTSGSQIGGCSNIDVKCICSSPTFISGIACCLAGACDAADQESATNFALSFCKAAGVTGLPTAVSCSSTIASTVTSAVSSSSATGAVTTSASSASSAESSGSSVASSVSSSASSVAASVTSKAASSSSSSATASATKNAGSHNMAGVGAGLLAAAVAML